MKRFNALAALLAALFISLVAGCGGGNKLVGTWEGTSNGLPATMIFESETFTVKALNPVNRTQGVTMKGKYTLADDKLAMTLTDAQLSGAAAEELAVFKAAMGPEMNKPSTSIIVWRSDTEFELTSAGGNSSTFKKK